MTRRRLAAAFRVLSLLGLYAVAWLTLRYAPVRADAAPALSPEVALARLCVNEAGLTAYRWPDCAAIHAVIVWRQEHLPAYRGLDYLGALHRYSDRVTVDRRDRGRPWILRLWPGGEFGGVDWERTLAHAVDVFRGTIRAECYGRAVDEGPVLRTPMTWGRRDIRPADPEAELLDCGGGLNGFWSIPHYVRRWGDPCLGGPLR